MAEDDLAGEVSNPEEEFDIDSESNGDLESVMQEALEAVEKASETIKAKEVGGSGEDAAGAIAPVRSDSDVEKMEEEIAELRDRSTRTLADFDNFRKRMDRERADERRYANLEILREFLSVVDNLERALNAESPAEDLKIGVELIHRQMKELMKNAGVERLISTGEEFDPRYHEAVSRHEDAAVSVPTVSDELQAGYVLHERLLRPAVVRVTMPIGDDSTADSETDGDEA